MIITKWTSPDGQTYDCLPKSWHNSSPITERFALAHGWVKHEEEVPDPVVIHRYSKYGLLLILDTKNLFQAFIDTLTDKERIFFDAAQELATNDLLFQSALLKMKTALELSDEQINEILEECEI